ncbi:hypothetical protein CEXT_473281 [Caerostris extrusa]|uniref:Uncharacterized protein n=1 Tax=Caerostris extrusa TaxID=172846 RepID=A0AAV4S4U9_CAEEX|nr:hypothetical protein CEXT_473281 [Caerostris extrusa]
MCGFCCSIGDTAFQFALTTRQGEEYMQPVLNSSLEEECILINQGQEECIKFSRFRENRSLYWVCQDLLVFLFDSPPLLLDFEIECVSPQMLIFVEEK